MTDNVGVKALLSWVNSIELSEQRLHIEDFQDGTFLLKVVHLLKREPIPPVSYSVADCFNLVAHFLEVECKFNATEGVPLSLNNIKDGVNLTVEVAKVLLLLVYHDVMNDRRTLNKLDCDVEREIATLTGSFVMENEGYVYLASGLVDYLESKCEEPPVIHHKRKQKISFVEMETVASSSVSTSPLQNIMNTPKFQLRKLQRQIIKERDYTEGLESELSAKMADITQKERHISQLQRCLDKLKKEQTDGEQAVREQIAELENKNDVLRMRLNEILKENKEFSKTSSLMERKMNELSEENGALSLQMRTVNPKLASCEAEIGRLTESYTCAEKGWKEKTSSLESELNEVTTQKECLTEQVEILQGKISLLEDEISSASKEEVGENMGHIMEREIFETEMKTLKSKLERALCSLHEAELCIQAKTQQLAECQEEMAHQKDLQGQRDHQTKRLMQEKDEMVDKLQQEISGQRVVLQQEIEDLKLRHQQAEQQKCEQIFRLQQQIVAQEEEAEKLRQTVKEKEALISLSEANLKNLQTEFSGLSSVLVDKDKQINCLGEKVEILQEESQQNLNKLQEKDQMLATLTLEKCNELEELESQIKLFTSQVETLTVSLKQAEQEAQNKQDLLVETQQLHVQQEELLQKDIAACEERIQTLNQEMHLKNEQLAILKDDCSCQVESLEKDRTVLEGQLEQLSSELREAAEQLQNEKVKLVKQEEESSNQMHLLQQRLDACEDQLRTTKEEMFKREDVIATLENQGLERSQGFREEIDSLQHQIECLRSSLRNAEDNVQSKETLLAEQTQQASRDMEELRVQVVTSQQEVEVLHAKMIEKEKQMVLLETDNASHSKLVQQQIVAQEEEAEKLRQTVKEKEALISLSEENLKNLQTEFSGLSSVLVDKDKQINCLGEKVEILQEESQQNINKLQEKDQMLATLTLEKCNELEELESQIKLFTSQVETLTVSLKQAEQEAENKQDLLVETQQLHVQQEELLQKDIAACEERIQMLNQEMHLKNEQLAILKDDCSCQVESLEKDRTVLEGQLEQLSSELREAAEQLQNEKVKLVKQEEESSHQMHLLQQRLDACEDQLRTTKEEMFKREDVIATLENQGLERSQGFREEIDSLQHQIECLRSSLRNAEDNVQSKENLLAEQTQQASRDMEELRVQVVTSQQEVEVLHAKMIEKEKQMVLLETDNASHSKLVQQQIETLNEQMQVLRSSLDLTQKELQAREDLVTKLKRDSICQKELLQSKEQMMQRLTERSTQLDLLNQTKEQEILQMRTDNAEQVVLLQQLLASANAEKQVAHEQQLAAHKDNELLTARINQAEKDRRSLQKQLQALSIQAKESAKKMMESEERYQAQVEMTVNHNNNKKQMERQLHAAVTENKMLQLELDKAQTSEKNLGRLLASLEAQLASTDQKLRAQNETVGSGKSSQSSDWDAPSTGPVAHGRVGRRRAISCDSLEQSSLEDPLNNTRHFCAPDESSTPRRCSPEPLTERRGFCVESPESSLYLTPADSRHGTEKTLEFVSGGKTPASSVKRRRTTQVINISMAKRTAGSWEADPSGRLASAASHPNLSTSSASVRPALMETFDTPARKMPPTGDQLHGLPGYRRSAVYPNAASTFCVGAENEPDGASEDWMRIAELQARNKACLPHLKSSYPVEFDNGSGGTFAFTDEELRSGDPSDTIRRASMMPGQLQDSLSSHRLSVMMANCGAAGRRSDRLSLMPGPLPARNTSLTQLRSSKDTKRPSSSVAAVLASSPEKRMKASCFPRPLTPKNKNMLSGPSSSVLHPTLSPAQRRQSMMFTIDNTPKSYLKKGLNKLRRSTRKSPSKSSKSPAQMAKSRGQENMPARSIPPTVRPAGRNGKSPHLATKSQKNIRSRDYKQNSKVANAES